MDEWFYTKMGLQQGPVPKEVLLEKIRRADISETSLIWTEGMPDWLPVSQIPELLPHQAPQPTNELPDGESPVIVPVVTTTPAIPEPQASGSQRLPQPAAYHGDFVPEHIPSYMVPSIIATVISCLSVFVCCVAPGVITGIVAIIYASQVDGLKAQGNVLGATSTSKTAKVWMIVTYSLLGLQTLTGIVFVVLAAVQ